MIPNCADLSPGRHGGCRDPCQRLKGEAEIAAKKSSRKEGCSKRPRGLLVAPWKDRRQGRGCSYYSRRFVFCPVCILDVFHIYGGKTRGEIAVSVCRRRTQLRELPHACSPRASLPVPTAYTPADDDRPRTIRQLFFLFINKKQQQKYTYIEK